MNLKSGFPYSLIQNGLVAEYPKLEEDKTTDVVIMGAGISGALSAYYLIQKGISCMVVDARSIGLGSTCASTSLLQYEIDIPLCKLSKMIGEKDAARSYELCNESIDALFKIAGDIGFENIYRKKSLYYAAASKDAKMLKEEYEIRRKHGFAVHLLDEAQVKSKMGFIAPAAILSESAAQTDAYLLTHALHRHSVKNGCEVFDRTTIEKITHHKYGVNLVTKEGCSIKCKKLVYATGYEVLNYIDKPVMKLHSTFAVISEILNEDISWKDMLLWNTADPYLYMRTTNNNRILVGGRDVDFYSPEKRDKLLPSKARSLVRDFNKLFPGVPFNAEFSWTGTFGTTKDGLPFIGTYKKLPHSYFALGFGGNGITFSVIAAQMISEELCGKKNSDSRLFSFERL